MGKDDLYPFVLAPAVIAKLGFVHASLALPRGDQRVIGWPPSLQHRP
jgi:hypothetical protein